MELQDKKEMQDKMDQMDMGDLMELKDKKEMLDKMDLMVKMDLMELKEMQDKMDQMELKDKKEMLLDSVLILHVKLLQVTLHLDLIEFNLLLLKLFVLMYILLNILSCLTISFFTHKTNIFFKIELY